jgi:hypothetical protein
MNPIRRTFPRLSRRIVLTLALAGFSTAAALSAQCIVQESRSCSTTNTYLFGFWLLDGYVTCTTTYTTICN